MCSIDWSGFTWQVATTLFAALAAVAIGWRQVGIADGLRRIAKGQAKIAKGQAKTAVLAQRAALFDKRFIVYQAIQAYISIQLEEAVGTKFYQGDDEFREDRKKIYVALHQAKFLFPASTRKQIDEATDMANNFRLIAGEQTLFPESDVEIKARKNRIQEKKMELMKTLRDLSERMGDEMNIFE